MTNIIDISNTPKRNNIIFNVRIINLRMGKKTTKFDSRTILRKILSDFRINPLITWTQIFLRQYNSEFLRSINSQRSIWIVHTSRSSRWRLRVWMIFFSHHSPVDSPPALEKSSEAEKLERDILPLQELIEDWKWAPFFNKQRNTHS